jgi:hypothetical protein
MRTSRSGDSCNASTVLTNISCAARADGRSGLACINDKARSQAGLVVGGQEANLTLRVLSRNRDSHDRRMAGVGCITQRRLDHSAHAQCSALLLIDSLIGAISQLGVCDAVQWIGVARPPSLSPAPK